MARLKFLFYATGIGLSYWYYGILQERITRTKHQPDNETFTCTMSLVLVQCLFNTIFSKFMLTFMMNQGIDRTKSTYYGICSLTYLTAMVSGNMALQYLNYPTQVVGKSCKPIPVMILGVLFGRKRHPPRKYFFVALIVIGVALFMYKKDIFESNSHTNSVDRSHSILSYISSLGIGELLLLLALTMDGMTGAIQERMKAEHRTKSGHMMFWINLWSTFYLLIATIATGELVRFHSFILKHPKLVYDILLFSSSSAIGQLFIFPTIAEFGPLPCSIITTTRKFFTVLTSVFIFGNKLTTSQWIGTSLVFSGLSLDAIYGRADHRQTSTETAAKKNN